MSSRQAHQHVFDDYILVPVVEVGRTSFAGKVYNIETSDHTYVASNVVVHNCYHKQGQRDVRPAEELAKLAERDPIKLLGDRLRANHGTDVDLVEVGLSVFLDEIFDEVARDPDPEFKLDE